MRRFGLALSGGGLRAALFHLGVVRFLHDARRLNEVTHIVSVSGGSILGAHLTLNWGRYTGSTADFEEAAAKIIEAITHGSPDFRKILQIVQETGQPSIIPLPIQQASQALPIPSYSGFEFLSGTSIVDLHDWRSATRDVAHYYRRLRIRRLAGERMMVLRYPRIPFDRINFQAGPEKLKPVVRRTPRDSEGKTTWELEFDMSNVRAGQSLDVEVEAVIHDYEARKGKHENWLRYTPPAPTQEASVWVLSPESQPCKDYRLVRYAVDDPTDSQIIGTQYTIDHPYGSIIAWSIVNAKPGYVYECEWTVDSLP